MPHHIEPSAQGLVHGSREARLIRGVSQRWLLIVSFIWAIYVVLPWLAPVFMWLNWAGAAEIIYDAYARHCHQLPQRSFFLFGYKFSYSLAEIQSAWQVTNDPALLRQFKGSPEMGWKVAWSDRMVSMYTTIFVAGLVYWPLRRRLRRLSLRRFLLLALPLVIDGSTHALSDLAGIGAGFRDTNAWLAFLTDNAFPPSFYAGDALGSFNSWMRLITGVLFGIGAVWLAYPYLDHHLGNQ